MRRNLGYHSHGDSLIDKNSLTLLLQPAADSCGLRALYLPKWNWYEGPKSAMSLKKYMTSFFKGEDRGQMPDDHKVGGTKWILLAVPRENICPAVYRVFRWSAGVYVPTG